MPEALRYNNDKPQLSELLQFGSALSKLAKVLEHGGIKYEPRNWLKGGKPDEEYLSAAMRHMQAYAEGEQFDSETGCHHIAHASWNLMALLRLNEGDSPDVDPDFDVEGYRDKWESGLDISSEEFEELVSLPTWVGEPITPRWMQEGDLIAFNDPSGANETTWSSSRIVASVHELPYDMFVDFDDGNRLILTKNAPGYVKLRPVEDEPQVKHGPYFIATGPIKPLHMLAGNYVKWHAWDDKQEPIQVHSVGLNPGSRKVALVTDKLGTTYHDQHEHGWTLYEKEEF